MLLEFPLVGIISNTVTLPKPIYGDSHQYNTNLIFHLTMSSGVKSYKKMLKEVMLLTFNNITNMDELVSFYLTVNGNSFRLVDHLLREWEAWFVSTPLEIRTDRGVGACALKSGTLQLAVRSSIGRYDYMLVDDEGNFLVDDDGNYLVYA